MCCGLPLVASSLRFDSHRAHVREEGATIMISNTFSGGVAAAGMARLVDAPGTSRARLHSAHPIAAAARAATPRKRRAAAGAVAASVRGAH
jgi:hypothetical protein